jgi:hypothetical protein
VSEPGTLTAELRVDEEQVRLAEAEGRVALRAVLGLDAMRAQARLRFGPRPPPFSAGGHPPSR